MQPTALAASTLALLLAACRPEDAGVVPDFDIPEAPEAAIAFPPEAHDAVAQEDTWWADCGSRRVPLSELLSVLADGMSRQRIPYGRPSPDEWRDCSGAFLRLSSYLASACPTGADYLASPPGVADYVEKGENTSLLVPRARSTRDLAWFAHAQGRFVPVWVDETGNVAASVEAIRHLLKPGTVVWFAKKPATAAGGLDRLMGSIHHVGTLIDVERNEDGEVVSYSMFHGRNPGAPASVTHDHSVERRPPFGNAGQFLVGVGALLPVVQAPPPLPPLGEVSLAGLAEVLAGSEERGRVLGDEDE